jgi:hypothetical protein
VIEDVIGIRLFFVCITETPEGPASGDPAHSKIERAPTTKGNGMSTTR